MPCSFCNSRGHDIRFCDNQMIGLLYERIKVIYVDTLREVQNTGNIEMTFKAVLNRRFNLRELRAVGVKFLNKVARLNKSQYIQTMYQHYSSRIYTIPESNQETRSLPTQPDPIPDFARDIEETSSQEDYDITWYIDTTPSQISTATFSMRELTTPQRSNFTQFSGRVMYSQFQQPINLMAHFDAVS